MPKEKEEEKVEPLGKGINLDDYVKEEPARKDEPEFGPDGKLITGDEPGGEEPKEEPDYVEVSLSTKMLIGVMGFALSMRYMPDKKAVKAFNEKYKEELPKVIENFGMSEIFEEVLGSTLSFKIKKSDVFAVPLPGWAGLAAVVAVLAVAGFAIKVPKTDEKKHEHRDAHGKKGLTEDYKEEPEEDKA